MSLDTQTRFAVALTDPASPVPKGLASWTGSQPERRFAVYRNNVIAALTGALAARFPASQQIVGEAFFAAMAADFIRAHPPRSPLLLSYGDDFAEFVERFEPAKAIAYLPDVIRLEAARGKAYHAADVASLDAATLAALSPERLADLVFVPHPSLCVLRSPHPVVTIWAMNAGEAALQPIDDWTAEDAVVIRPHMIVEVRRLPPGGAAFLQALAQGTCLAAAVDIATEDADAFDLSANLAGALQSGAFIAFR
ncbi:hypothetical protein BLJAPNOD_02579 [Ensifer sp. M14]|uniref:HvfC/BufC N-terminal domain-containing protein n=1 Tax=Ensifer sp. M14 TaxID=2203782 RepID=UPI000E1C7331|nr:DNA-binding domain-containing protein [Ensifer sp. M14]RDL51445.1 hypothetical protein BLJAPNOD_02579 [Ensifer sp. M14]